MVSHQAEQVEPHAVFLDRLSQPFDEAFAIAVIIEYGAAIHASDGDVLDRTFVMHSQLPCHASKIGLVPTPSRA